MLTNFLSNSISARKRVSMCPLLCFRIIFTARSIPVILWVHDLTSPNIPINIYIYIYVLFTIYLNPKSFLCHRNHSISLLG